MISYLKGKVKLFKWGLIILDVHGVGYKIVVNPQIAIKNNIVDTGEEVEFFIHEHIREDADDLYGFITYQELELFEMLISVNGVGPKAGMNIMSFAKSDRIVSAISTDDVGFFTNISGIGKKAATKIILDLKSKVSGDKNINVLSRGGDSNDLFDALARLGYKNSEIAAIITKIPADIMDLEEKVRWCLKNLARS